jgi:hypothetical protein
LKKFPDGATPGPYSALWRRQRKHRGGEHDPGDHAQDFQEHQDVSSSRFVRMEFDPKGKKPH